MILLIKLIKKWPIIIKISKKNNKNKIKLINYINLKELILLMLLILLFKKIIKVLLMAKLKINKNIILINISNPLLLMISSKLYLIKKYPLLINSNRINHILWPVLFMDIRLIKPMISLKAYKLWKHSRNHLLFLIKIKNYQLMHLISDSLKKWKNNNNKINKS